MDKLRAKPADWVVYLCNQACLTATKGVLDTTAEEDTAKDGDPVETLTNKDEAEMVTIDESEAQEQPWGALQAKQKKGKKAHAARPIVETEGGAGLRSLEVASGYKCPYNLVLVPRIVHFGKSMLITLPADQQKSGWACKG